MADRAIHAAGCGTNLGVGDAMQLRDLVQTEAVALQQVFDRPGQGLDRQRGIAELPAARAVLFTQAGMKLIQQDHRLRCDFAAVGQVQRFADAIRQYHC